jgi:hypothetical protein
MKNKSEIIISYGLNKKIVNELKAIISLEIVDVTDELVEKDRNKNLYEYSKITSHLLLELNKNEKLFLRYCLSSDRFYKNDEKSLYQRYDDFMNSIWIVGRLIEKWNPDVIVFANLPHEKTEILLDEIAKLLCIKTIYCFQSIFPDKIYISKSKDLIFDFDCIGSYSETDTKREDRKELVPFYMKKSFRGGFIKRNIVKLHFYVRNPKALIVDLKFAVNNFIHTLSTEAMFELIDASKLKRDSFVYIPLHYQPELTVTVLGPVFNEQIRIVEYMRSILPDHIEIIVKENPKQTKKQRGTEFYKRIKNIPNCRLIKKGNSNELIINSLGVCTISGTAGYEALKVGVPVVLFGESVWYQCLDGVIRYKDVTYDKLRNIKDHINLINNSKIIDIMRSSLYEGVVDDDYYEISNFDKNISAIRTARSINNFISTLKLNDDKYFN